MGRAATTGLCGLLLVVTACGSSDNAPLGSGNGGGGGPDAGIDGPGPIDRQMGPVIEATRIREDFDSRQFIDTTSVALLDVNRGQVTLPSVVLPEVGDAPENDIRNVVAYQGVVEAGTILVQDAVELQGDDAVELRARGELRIIGDIRAGPGGVTLIAGTGVRVDGAIESEGPVRIRVSDEAEGQVEISGRIVTLATDRQRSASINILTRGSVLVSGQLETGGGTAADTGNIEINTYGTITVSGGAARLVTGASVDANAGDIELTTEAKVEVLDGAQMIAGESNADLGRAAATQGGSVIIRAEQINLGSSAILTAGHALNGTGGSLRLSAADRLNGGEFIALSAGDGAQGGDVELSGRVATFMRGGTARAGAGDSISGRVFVELSEDVQMTAFKAFGGAGGCADGGPIVALVGGRLTVDVAVELRGGAGGTNVGDACLGSFAGGDVTIFARETSGPEPSSVAFPGDGSPAGQVRDMVVPTYTHEVPGISVRAVGFLVSKVIDRGERSRGLVPQLLEARLETPPGTIALIQLAQGATTDGPFGQWYDAVLNEPDALAPVAGARFLRYRVWLQGRSLDTPVFDGFDLDLAPSL